MTADPGSMGEGLAPLYHVTLSLQVRTRAVSVEVI
jgi:hypothetical protein